MELMRNISVAWSLFHTLIMFVFLYESRYPKKQNLALTFSFMIPLCVLNLVLFILLGPTRTGQLLLFTMILPSLIFFFFMAKRRDGRFFFTFCLTDTIAYEVIIITAILDKYLFFDKCVFMLVSRLILFPVLELIIVRFVRKPYVEIQHYVKKGWTLMAIASAMCYLLFVIMAAFPTNIAERPDDIPVAVIALVLTPIIYFAFFKMLKEQKNSFLEQEVLILRNKADRLLRNELDVEKELVASARRFRHDLRHHTAVIREYLLSGDVDGTLEYLAEYDQAIVDTTLKSFCENKTINAILRRHARRCEVGSIRLSVNVTVPEELPLSQTETVSVFANVFENAYEAAIKCPDKFIDIFAEQSGGMLRVEVRNSVRETVKFRNDSPVTTKHGGGTGVFSMKSALSKYGGMLMFKQERGVFITQILIPLS